ncbi:N-acetylglucosamine-6-phosphate deacetylase [Jeotgalibacillus sp. R-1-5s-1]|uniref:N-acetylglucosamine-6-phosphate deacetylase n=1 Tax=Jeotgalibacillus sp. R-1-5s-1 TaxID=2555897 RepID=UPI00106AFC37|nr:N-acetylglucosamine-6-phosphate deacetylase [Jeotgalibacillus sp. R-1-5s-1]TFD99922.1 N-acetylglucosamine-6-phosphate deacetylase [Jeotgalibacillus sp. R-1-5s-1]
MTQPLIIQTKKNNKDWFIQIQNGRIFRLGHETEGMAGDVLQVPDGYHLLPGFIDTHIHGAYGADVMDATSEALQTIADGLVREGVTSFLATTMTQSKEAILNAVKNAGTFMDQQVSGAELLGIHLEGPFLSPDKAGAQNRELMTEPDENWFNSLQKLSGHSIKVVTAAPELAGGIAFFRRYAKELVMSIGHSNASYQDALDAIEAGASQVTHLYNQMSPFHHRDPGVTGAALLHPELKAELIVDLVHVHPDAVRLAWSQKGADGLILITDAMRAKGLKNGLYDLGGQKIEVLGKAARLVDGTLAGSVLTMETAVQHITDIIELTDEELVKISSENAAKQLGIFDRKGSIEKGKDADFVVMNENYQVVTTIINGVVAFNKM